MAETLQDKGKRLQKMRDYKLDVDKYIIAHIDGRSFSRMVKNKFEKPFDGVFIKAMNDTASYLCENVQGAKIAYVQSDEISLLIKKDTPEGDVFFGGRMCKMQSIIAALATSKFNQIMMANGLKNLSDGVDKDYVVDHIMKSPLYQFDCKVWDVDTANDAFAWFLFRNIDCARNSKQQAAQTYIPHKELLNKETDEQIKMLKDRFGIDWNEYSADEKYGRIVSKEMVNCQRVIEDPSTKEMTVVEYYRSVWVAHPGVNLTDEEQRSNFINKYSFFKD